MMQDIQNQAISERTELLINKLLLGKFNLAEIAKIIGISEQFLQNYFDVSSYLHQQVLSESSNRNE